MRPNLRGSALVLALLLGAEPARAAAHSNPRPHGSRVAVSPADVRVMDGDTAEIRWARADVETVRVLGVNTPELRARDERRGGSLDPRGAEARGFARGAFALARRVELLRARGLDRYGRTLGYFFLDGRNYSVMVIEAGLARETISRYGDNGLPEQASEVRRAVRRSAPTARRR